MFSKKSDPQKILASLRNDPEALIRLCLKQRQRIEELSRELEAEREHRRELEERVEELEREAKRPAAPFRRPEHRKKDCRKKPGRKGGHKGQARAKPTDVDQRIEVPLTHCPDCGERLHHTRPVEQFIEDLPEVRPVITHLITYRARCSRCKKHVKSTHPLQVSEAVGAAGVALGPRAVAIALELKHKHGLSKRKICRILKDHFHLSISPGGLSQLFSRMADRLRDRYDDLKEQARQSEALHVDETSWWIGGPAWLWVFTNQDFTLYRAAHSRGRAVLLDLIGNNFDGVLVSDCLNIYDDTNPRQQKCYSHHLQAVSQALGKKPRSAFLQQIRGLLKGSLDLKKNCPDPHHPQRKALRATLGTIARDLLSAPRDDPVEEYVRRRLAKQADHLFTFLDTPGVDATNNIAERQLRPAVIARKISCGNKTDKGARTWQILTSLFATAEQHGTNMFDNIQEVMRVRAT